MDLRLSLVVLLVVASFISVIAKKGGRNNGERRGGQHNNRGHRRGQGRTSEIEYNPPFSGQRIRLAGDERWNVSSGNVEVYMQNRWGMVCDDDWTFTDAMVTCRQLGFQGLEAKATHESYFGMSTWNTSDILLDDVACKGSEGSVLRCTYQYPSNCHTNEGAGVVCSYYTGCPDGWIAGPDSCYLLSTITTTQQKYAEQKCLNQGGYLVNIETEAENHFLSTILDDEPGEPIITGAVKKRNVWLWRQTSLTVSSSRYRRAQRRGPRRQGSARHANSRTSSGGSTSVIESTQEVSIQYFKWFPGWFPSNKNAEPSDKKKEKCLYLDRMFPHPIKSRGNEDVGYLFWKDDICKRTKKRMKNGFRYLCERPRNKTDSNLIEQKGSVSEEVCYHGNGETYRGTVAQTERGTPCVMWEDSNKHTPSTSPDKGLEGNNYCRNPDGDTRPWCYVNQEGKFGFCSIPQCESQSQVEVTTTQPTTTTAEPVCAADQFFCSSSSSCISGNFQCDHEADCSDNEDEQGCTYKITKFKELPFKMLSTRYVKETLNGQTNETCARACLNTEKFVCRSFGFHLNTRKCTLSDTNTQLTGAPLYSILGGSVYELISQSVNCEGSMFKCSNGRCIDKALVCDYKDDCRDLSDEINCGEAEPVEVRLVDGDENSGRVEVKYRGEWGVICDDNWDSNDAAVVCKMLGYTRLASSVATGHSRYGKGTGVFLLDEVACIGTESSIEECGHPGWKVHDCRSFEVAGVVCEDHKGCLSDQFTCSNQVCITAQSVCDGICNCLPGCEDEKGHDGFTCSSGVIEVVDGNQEGSGRVEIVRNGLRGTICDDSWGHEEATVICRMMGFESGEATSGASFGEGNGPIWLDDLECTGTEVSLTNCVSSNWGVTDCTHAEDAGVVCSNDPITTQAPTPGTSTLTIVLVDGPSAHEGRVEVIWGTERGTVCDDQWDDVDAEVVCKILGYRGGSARTEAFYGPGIGDIVLDDVNCAGHEGSLMDCGHAGWGTSDCGHGEDAGVKCHMASGGGGEDPAITGDENMLLPPSVVCGLRPMESSTRKKREDRESRELAPPPKFERIVGGFTASRGFYPWQVGVRRHIQEGYYSHWCGGTIIGDLWILSAAHCFTDLRKSSIHVRTGDHDNKVSDTYEQEFELDQLISHPRYNDENYDYDLALLKIKPDGGQGINFTEHVQPACLPKDDTPFTVGDKCYISGWGKTEHGYQNLLKSAKVPLLSDQVCSNTYKSITANMFCAGYMEGGIDSCSGDSGGPLVCEINGRYTVLGATSWGAGCAEANAPGVYAKVTEFLPWIWETIAKFP